MKRRKYEKKEKEKRRKDEEIAEKIIYLCNLK